MRNCTIVMKSYNLVVWPTMNPKSFEILRFLYGGFTEGSSLLGPVAVSLGISLNKRHSITLRNNRIFETHEPHKPRTSFERLRH